MRKHRQVQIIVTVLVVSAVGFHLAGYGFLCLCAGCASNVYWVWED